MEVDLAILDLTNRQDLLADKVTLPAGSVVIAGCGGVGYNAAIYLALMGVKSFLLFDHDVFTDSNLGRIPVPPSALNRPKVEVLKEEMLRLRPNLEVSAVVGMVDSTILEALRVAGNKIGALLCAVDNHAAVADLYRFCQASRIPFSRAGVEDQLVCVAGRLRNLIDTAPDQSGYRIVPSWPGSTLVAAALSLYPLVYPKKDFPPVSFNVISDVLLKPVEG
jgi:hypothetical protein